MQVAKSFDRNGIRYRAGDSLPEDIDKSTLEHYKRHGMVREVKPETTKPAAPRRRAAQEPKQTKPAGPSNAVDLARVGTVSPHDDLQSQQQNPVDVSAKAEVAKATDQVDATASGGGESGGAVSSTADTESGDA